MHLLYDIYTGERTLFLPHGPHAVADLRDSVAGSFMVGLGSSKR